jgi:hypothetical protein
MVITAKPFGEMTLAELRKQQADYEALLSRTTVISARARVADVCDMLATWIAKREREVAA